MTLSRHLSLAGEGCVFLAGVSAGIGATGFVAAGLISVGATTSIPLAWTPFLLPDVVYPAAMVGLVVLSVLLKRAARQKCDATQVS